MQENSFYAAREKVSSLWACATAERNLEHSVAHCFAICRPFGCSSAHGLGHENLHGTGEEFGASFRDQCCLWRKFSCAHALPQLLKTWSKCNCAKVKWCQICFFGHFWDFTLDKHFNDLFLKGTVADQKTCGIPAWPVNLWPFIPTGKARLLHSPREKRMCWPVASLEPIEQHVHVIPHVTSTILHEHHLKKITKVVEISWVIIHNNAGILYFNIHVCSYALSLSANQKTQWEIPKSKTLSPQTSQPRRRQLCPPLVLFSSVTLPACPWKLIIDTEFVEPKNTNQILTIQCVQCKENDRFHTYYHIPYHISARCRKSFMIDSWNFVKRFIGCFWRKLPPKKGTEMTMSLEGKNTTEQLWKCSHLICWWTSARNLHESMRFKSPLRNNRRKCKGWVPNKQVTRLSPAPKNNVWGQTFVAQFPRQHFDDAKFAEDRSWLNGPTSVPHRWCCANSWVGMFGDQFIHGSDSVHGVLNFWIKIPSRNVSKFMWPQKSSLERDSADHETKNRNTSEDWTKIRFHQFPHLATCVLEDCNHTPYITKHETKNHRVNTPMISHSSQETAFRNSQKYRLPFFSWSTFPKISCKASRFSSVHSPAMPVSMASTSAKCEAGRRCSIYVCVCVCPVVIPLIIYSMHWWWSIPRWPQH